MPQTPPVGEGKRRIAGPYEEDYEDDLGYPTDVETYESGKNKHEAMKKGDFFKYAQYVKEIVNKQHTYQGKRIKRGLFKSAKGILINADVNAACNILRKVFPKAFSFENIEGIVGNVLYPKCYNL